MLGEILLILSIDMLLCYLFLDIISTNAYNGVIIIFVLLFGLLFVMDPFSWFCNLGMLMLFNYFITVKLKDRYIDINCKVR